MADSIWIAADRLFPGGGAAPLADRALRIEDGRIAAIATAADIPPGARAEWFEVVAPGFVDLQINGGGGVNFNDAPTVETLAQIARAARRGGTAQLMATFITARGNAYEAAIEAVGAAIGAGVPGILGAHLEGPFIAPTRPGIHPASAIRPLTAADVERIGRASHPVLVTLAPEAQDPALVAALAATGARVFAGHTEARAEDIAAAAEAGVTGLTHLWNAMSQLTGRAPGAVGAVLSHPRLVAGLIADGVHVHPMNLALAARLMEGRLFLVTDAMATLGAPDCCFSIGGVPIRLDGDRLVSPEGTLAGAQLAMDAAVRNMVRLAGVAPEAALDMAAGAPARAMGLDDRFGTIAPERSADLTCLDAGLHARRVMIGGHWPD